MIEKNQNAFLQMQLTSTGIDYITKNHKLAKWLFGISTVLIFLVFADEVLLFFIYNQPNRSGLNSTHNILSVIQAQFVPLLVMVQVLFYAYGAYNYFRFASQIKKSTEEINEEDFNNSFRYILRSTSTFIFQTCIALIVYSTTTIFALKRITHHV